MNKNIPNDIRYYERYGISVYNKLTIIYMNTKYIVTMLVLKERQKIIKTKKYYMHTYHIKNVTKRCVYVM